MPMSTSIDKPKPLSVPVGWHEGVIAARHKEMPPGWVSYTSDWNNVGEDLVEEYGGIRSDLQHYRHESDPSPMFWFPFPLATRTTEPLLEEHLHMHTLMGLFKLGQVRGMMTRILAMDGQPAGTLWQHNEQDADFVEATTGPIAERCSIEVVAVSDNSVPRSEAVVCDVEELLDDEHLDTRFAPQLMDTVVNVIWVRKDGDVYYRKATGVIDGKVFHETDTVECDVILA